MQLVDGPLILRFIDSLSDEALRKMMEQSVLQKYYRGEIFAMPSNYEVQVIELKPQRFEPDIEDEC